MQYRIMQLKLAMLLIAQAVVKKFIIPVTSATVASVNATFSLPHNIILAVQEAKNTAKLDAEMDDALIDHDFLNRAMMGVTEDESSNIKSIMDEMRRG